jgi:hypothetical protein
MKMALIIKIMTIIMTMLRVIRAIMTVMIIMMMIMTIMMIVIIIKPIYNEKKVTNRKISKVENQRNLAKYSLWKDASKTPL